MLKKLLLSFAKLAVSFGLMYLLYRKIPLSQIGEVMRAFDLRFLPYICLLLLVNTFLSAWKWHILLRSDGIEISLLTLTGSYMVGSFFNMFLPSNIGGDFYRIVDVMKRSQDTIRSATSVFADRLSGFFALVSLSLISSIFVVLKTNRFFFFFLPLTIFLLLICLIWLLYNQQIVHKILRLLGLHRFDVITSNIDKICLSFSRYGSQFNIIVKILLISFSFQSLVIVIVYLLAKSVGVAVSFFYFSAFVPLISLMEALPISIYGIGVRDFGYEFFFDSSGMGDPQTRSLALMYFAMTVVYSLAGGVIFLGRIFNFPIIKRGSGE
jgi:glycosyltransferase 2 family protein